MKNLTVSLDDDTYRRARLRAAEMDKSLSALVREFLNKMSTEETEFERLARLERELRAKLKAEGRGLDASQRLSRDELYDRERARREVREARE
jgi:plasmid stability protein